MIINSFKGIHNTNPARSIPDNALVDAVDVDIDNLGVISKRAGQTVAAIAGSPHYLFFTIDQTSPDEVIITSIITAYTTLDGVSYLFVNGLKNSTEGVTGLVFMVQPDLELLSVTDAQGLSILSTAIYFADFGKILFTNDGYKINGTIASKLKIPTPEYPPYLEVSSPYVDGEMAFYKAVYCYRNLVTGMEGGSSPIEIIACAFDSTVSVTPPAPPDGYEAIVYVTEINGSTYYSYDGYQLAPVQILANPFPDNISKIEYHDERLWLSQAAPNGMSMVWYSDKYHYHLYDAVSNYLVVPGQVRDMASTAQGLVICTDAAIYVWVDSLQLLAGYGVPEGKPISKHPDGTVLIQSNRGICSVFPFQNITEKKVVQEAISTCYSAIIYKNGINRFISISQYTLPFSMFPGLVILSAGAGGYVIDTVEAILNTSNDTYTLQAGAGSFSISPQSATLTIENPIPDYELTCQAGAFSIAGQPAALTLGEIIPDYTLTGVAGAFSISPQDATLTIA